MYFEYRVELLETKVVRNEKSEPIRREFQLGEGLRPSLMERE